MKPKPILKKLRKTAVDLIFKKKQNNSFISLFTIGGYSGNWLTGLNKQTAAHVLTRPHALKKPMPNFCGKTHNFPRWLLHYSFVIVRAFFS